MPRQVAVTVTPPIIASIVKHPRINLEDLEDTNIVSPNDKDDLVWDATSQKWINRTVSDVDGGTY